MSKPYILAVDDDPDVLGTLYRALTREGYEVGRASSGAEALHLLAARRPDLIILDIIMPGLDGLTVCRRIRANSQYDDLAILFLTARGQTDDIVAGLDAGGDDYVVKPFEIAELTARVRALIRRGQRSAVLESPVLTGGTAATGLQHASRHWSAIRHPDPAHRHRAPPAALHDGARQSGALAPAPAGSRLGLSPRTPAIPTWCAPTCATCAPSWNGPVTTPASAPFTASAI
ncbi:MAG: hypothetical protein KatS3mg051_0858 [Anaerolineae bacterium]|nr:MAG: hypothetical protein KatS3mg051_0858 [Anaerolineae bacterium]